ncbi:BRF1 domain containing protein [Amanita muscaria]
MPICSDCGGTVIEYDHAAGNGFCVACGTVVEENTIVNEIEFGETSAGAAVVQGSYVAQGSTRARMSGPYGNRGSSESREQTIANASKKIQSIANVLRLSEHICLSATRLYTLAVEHKFTKGRKSLNVVAVCLYVACRQKETRNYMMIDFSDLLQVNVFELGHTYLQLVQTLNLRLPLVDPSHYIARFAALLEFGDETNKVATDAIRLVSRFDRDWMSRGRRPAGICGAALLLAARMNNFRRSVEEIVQVVKIADTTLKKRIEEFRRTPSGQLTLADFRRVWLDEEMDPPAFTKGREKEDAERRALEAAQSGTGEMNGKRKGKEKEVTQKRKRKRKRVGNSDDEIANVDETTAPHLPPHPPLFDPTMLNQGILQGMNHMPLFAPDPEEEDGGNMNIDPSLLQQSFPPPPPTDTAVVDGSHYGNGLHPSAVSVAQQLRFDHQEAAGVPDYVDEAVSNVIVEEVSKYLGEGRAAQVRAVLDEQEEEDRVQRMEREEERKKRALAWKERAIDDIEVVVAQDVVDAEEEDWTLGLNDDELDRFLLSEDEVKIKERVWVELNRDYLEALAAKGEQQDSGSASKNRKRRKPLKPRDATTPSGSTVTESVQNLVKKNPKYSRRINYDALKELFVDSGGMPLLAEGMTTGDDEKDDRELIEMDLYSRNGDVGDGDGDETQPQLIVEEGTVGVVGRNADGEAGIQFQKRLGALDGLRRPFDDDGRGGDGEEMSDEEKDVDDDDPGGHYGGWEDAYEQEI